MKWSINNITNVKDKIVLITGGNSGLGFECAKALASKGAKVTILCRNAEKGKSAVKEINKTNPVNKASFEIVDLADLSSITDFATNFKSKQDKIDILINNAGIMMVPYSKTKDGFESQFGTNHLGHFALTALLFDLIKNNKDSRIVNVSSNAHLSATIDFDNLQFENGEGYTPMKAYSQSKLANLLFTYRLDQFCKENHYETIVVAAHPGIAKTNLAEHLEGKLAFKLLRPILELIAQDQDKGALPILRAATEEGLKGSEYFGPDGFREMKGDPIMVDSNDLSKDKEVQNQLWNVSERLTGAEFS